MIENCVGCLSLPLGVAPTFVINGRHYVVPMAVEEPSVVAAASGIGKLVSEEGGGFTVESGENLMIGQIQLLDITHAAAPQADSEHDAVDAVIAIIQQQREELLRQGNSHCLSMVKRGGGMRDIHAERRVSRSGRAADSVIVFLKVDVCDSMGANIVNSICEGLSPSLLSLLAAFRPRLGLRILSNLCVDRRTAASFRLPFSALAYKGVDGAEVARRVVEAFEFACDDEFRAVTNNKGVMNGMDAVAIATGQDWRALEAAAHAWAAVRHRFDSRYPAAPYGPLCTYSLSPSGHLVGRCDIPISVGTAGGAISSHPLYSLTLALLHHPTARELAGVIVSVGLAQNFAALRALAIEGIQRGHMSLHARNIALAAGVTDAQVQEVADWLNAIGRVSKAEAEAYWKRRQQWAAAEQPSALYVEATAVRVRGVQVAVQRIVLFDSGGGAVSRLLLSTDAKAAPAAAAKEAEALLGSRAGGLLQEALKAVETECEEEAEWELLRTVLALAVQPAEGEQELSAVKRRIAHGLVMQLDTVRSEWPAGDSKPSGAGLLAVLSARRNADNGVHAHQLQQQH